MNRRFIRRRWLDFRWGHGLYLIFALSFANFILIFHRLLIERVEFLNEIFSSLWFFALVFVILYIPISIVIGIWHRKTQLSVENELTMKHNVFLARNFRVLLDVIEGKATKEEIQNFRALLTKIESGRGTSKD